MAVIDNGSPFTMISENDLKRTRLPLKSLPIVGKAIYIAPVNLVDLGECNLTFKDIKNETITFKFRIFGSIFKDISKSAYFIHQIPSVIGRDFLKKFNFSLKRERKKVFLET